MLDSLPVEEEVFGVLAGLLRAIMYRTLRTVELKRPLIDDRVSTILVAHGFNVETREVAERYNIRLIDVKARN
jgi:hypothetical protein